MKNLKEILSRSVGLVLATFFGGTAVGAVAGNWLMGSIIGVGSAFAVVLTTVGVNLAWKGSLQPRDIQNAYRAAVAQVDSEAVKDALAVTEDGDFDWEDIHEDYDPEAEQA